MISKKILDQFEILQVDFIRYQDQMNKIYFFKSENGVIASFSEFSIVQKKLLEYEVEFQVRFGESKASTIVSKELLFDEIFVNDFKKNCRQAAICGSLNPN